VFSCAKVDGAPSVRPQAVTDANWWFFSENATVPRPFVRKSYQIPLNAVFFGKTHRRRRFFARFSVEMQAKQAWALRNAFRTATRNAMMDQVTAAELNATRPNLTWEKTVEKYSPRFADDELWNQIIGASQRSNANVNKALGVAPPGGTK
jgi:hypothetical protein